ncbi:DeoR/GlpR family DNA-binding transcription regulator [Rhodobacteraceae bacterium KMM 6894]|nr:DeoR/GlpR family DNA-binding transcription regulator [Rhodobacteraceae bacterium KMM 6894]
MSAKKRQRRDQITDIVLERGAITVGALADLLEVSTQTIRRDIDILCEGDTLRRRHGRIELDAQHLNTPFDQRAGTNLAGKRAIGAAAARLIPDGATLFMSIGSTPLSVARALHRRKNLTVITNNLSAAMALSDEQSNRIILPGGEVRLPDRDILGEDVLDFFGRYRAEFGIFGAAGVTPDGSLLDFHTAEVRVRQRIRDNAQVSILVMDHSKFGRMAPAAGDCLADMDHVILDRRPESGFEPVIDSLGDRLTLAEGNTA